jgi:hypothetical protein
VSQAKTEAIEGPDRRVRYDLITPEACATSALSTRGRERTMSNHELIALLKRRFEQALKAYGTALFEYHDGYIRIFGCEVLIEEMQESPDLFDGRCAGECPLNNLFYRYLLMLQAGRDMFAGHAVEGEPLNQLIAAFEEWIEKDWQETKEGSEP